MATQTIDATLFASSHPDIVKRTSVSGLIFSVAMLLVGVFIFASIFEMSDKSSTLSMALMVLGTAFVLLGVFRLFWKSKEVVYLPTGSVTKERSVFFDLKYLGKLTDMIENEQLNGETEIKSSGSGNVRMDVMISQDNKFAAVQLYQFVPYTYTPVTSVRYYTGSDAVAVSTFLEKCKTAQSVKELDLTLTVVGISRQRQSPFFSSGSRRSYSGRCLGASGRRRSVHCL